MKFNELVRLLEREGYGLVKEKGSGRYFANREFRGYFESIFTEQVPTGTCHAVLEAAGIGRVRNDD